MYDGIDGWMCPWESGCAAIFGADKCQKRGAARWRGAPATSASLASTWQVTGQSWVLLLPRPRWEHLPLAGMFPPFTQIGRRISQFSSLHVFIKFIL